jgi:hypothetical protein
MQPGPANHHRRCFSASWYRPCRSYHRSFRRPRKLPRQLSRGAWVLRQRGATVLHQRRAQRPLLARWVLWRPILRQRLLPLQLALLYRASDPDSFLFSRLQLGLQSSQRETSLRAITIPGGECSEISEQTAQNLAIFILEKESDRIPFGLPGACDVVIIEQRLHDVVHLGGGIAFEYYSDFAHKSGTTDYGISPDAKKRQCFRHTYNSPWLWSKKYGDPRGIRTTFNRSFEKKPVFAFGQRRTQKKSEQPGKRLQARARNGLLLSRSKI